MLIRKAKVMNNTPRSDALTSLTTHVIIKNNIENTWKLSSTIVSVQTFQRLESFSLLELHQTLTRLPHDNDGWIKKKLQPHSVLSFFFWLFVKHTVEQLQPGKHFSLSHNCEVNKLEQRMNRKSETKHSLDLIKWLNFLKKTLSVKYQIERFSISSDCDKSFRLKNEINKHFQIIAVLFYA